MPQQGIDNIHNGFVVTVQKNGSVAGHVPLAAISLLRGSKVTNHWTEADWTHKNVRIS